VPGAGLTPPKEIFNVIETGSADLTYLIFPYAQRCWSDIIFPCARLAVVAYLGASTMLIFVIEIETGIDKSSWTMFEIEIEIVKGCSTMSTSNTISVVDYRD
jgi:hypothetical protein